MNIQIHYGTGVITLPADVLTMMERATKHDLRLLVLLASDPALLSAPSFGECVARLSERLGCTPAQVEASLSFWRGTGTLRLSIDGEPAVTASAVQASVPHTQQSPVSVAQAPAVHSGAAASADRRSGEIASPNVETERIRISRSGSLMLDEIPNYTTDELVALLNSREQAGEAINECQNVWGGMFNTRDLNIIMSLVDVMGFQWDYVITLLRFAAGYFRQRENQGKSLNYVYRMASELHKDGVFTLEALQTRFVELEKLSTFEGNLRTLFGMGERALTPREKKYISSWVHEFHYGMDVVTYAYNIAVDRQGKLNMGYINGILKNWHALGLTTLAEIQAMEESDDRALKEAKGQGSNAPETAPESDFSTPEEPGSPRDLQRLRRLLDLGNRTLTEEEASAFTRWRCEYGYSLRIVFYAYEITVQARGDYNLYYMDAVLRNWHESRLTTMEEIRAANRAFKEGNARTSGGSKGDSAPSGSSGKRRTKAPATGQSSFDSNDFFLAAVKRSFGEDFDPSVFDSD